MSYQINLGQWKSVFAVPSALVDQHIKIASEAQLKVLLYLLRHAEEELSDEQLSSALRLSEEEVKNAVDFWIERELLAHSEGVLAPSAAVKTEQKPVIPAEEKPKKQHTALSRARRPDPDHVSKLLRENKLLSQFMEEAQGIMQKTLSPGDTATLVMLYDSFGLPCEVITLLIQHLSSTGNANMRSIEKMGINWADDGIRTVQDAEAKIAQLNASREAWGRVSSLLGIRNVGHPTKAQMENAHRWLDTWSFNDEMIVEAYERCVNTKGEYNMSYTNAILKRWHEKGINSLDRLREEESAKRHKPKAKARKSGKGSVFSVEGASFDVSQYENNSLFDD